MKTVKAICAASVMALFLSFPAYATDPPPPGDIHVPGKPNPITGVIAPPGTAPSGAPAVDGDLSFSALADILWSLAWIF